eukprot:6175857-Pleurochrysis_carterae.AAC.2
MPHMCASKCPTCPLTRLHATNAQGHAGMPRGWQPLRTSVLVITFFRVCLSVPLTTIMAAESLKMSRSSSLYECDTSTTLPVEYPLDCFLLCQSSTATLLPQGLQTKTQPPERLVRACSSSKVDGSERGKKNSMAGKTSGAASQTNPALSSLAVSSLDLRMSTSSAYSAGGPPDLIRFRTTPA